MAAATETRGQNSFVNYSGINAQLQKEMADIRKQGGLAIVINESNLTMLEGLLKELTGATTEEDIDGRC